MLALASNHMYVWLADFWPQTEAQYKTTLRSIAANDIECVSKGVEIAALWCAVLALGIARIAGPRMRRAFTVVCAYGALEGALIAICGLAYMAYGAAVDEARDLCDRVTGWQTYVTAAGLAFLVLVAPWISRRA